MRAMRSLLVLATPVCLAALCTVIPSAQSGSADSYTRYELLDPATSSIRITEDVSATTAGARVYVERLSPGSQATGISVIDRLTGQPLTFEVVENELRVQLARPVPKGGETRLRISKTSREPRVYGATGTEIEFQRPLGGVRNVIVLPEGYEILSSNVPSQVIEEADGRLMLSHWQTGPTAPWIALRARQRPAPSAAAKAPPVTSAPVMTPGTPATSARNELANLRITERAVQDREIVYFLQQPETHSFRLYHDYTESRPGVATYRNVVRGGSSVSDPSAVLLDTGESLRVETVKEGDAVVVVIHFPAIEAGRSSRLRITETYTDAGRYGLVDGQLVWNRNFGRPANDVVLPEGWYLTDSAIPGVISTEPDGRTRVAFINPRPDSIDVVLKARRR